MPKGIFVQKSSKQWKEVQIILNQIYGAQMIFLILWSKKDVSAKFTDKKYVPSF